MRSAVELSYNSIGLTDHSRKKMDHSRSLAHSLENLTDQIVTLKQVME